MSRCFVEKATLKTCCVVGKVTVALLPTSLVHSLKVAVDE